MTWKTLLKNIQSISKLHLGSSQTNMKFTYIEQISLAFHNSAFAEQTFNNNF